MPDLRVHIVKRGDHIAEAAQFLPRSGPIVPIEAYPLPGSKRRCLA
jgi:hypothetical protein